MRKNTKDTRLEIRVTQEEKQAIQHIATEQGTTVSSLIRNFINTLRANTGGNN